MSSISFPAKPNAVALPAAALVRAPAREKRRLGLWELASSQHCSVVGTCLSEEDLLAVVRRARLVITPGARSYDIHGYFVGEAGRPTPVSRLMTKMLDKRYAGAVRRVGATSDAQALAELWQHFLGSGQIAAGYWAFVSHTHVPEALATRVFGDVHMLSHQLGQGARELAARAATLEARCRDLTERLQRSERAKAEGFESRDATIRSLESRLRKQDSVAPSADAHARLAALEQALQRADALKHKRERVILAARTRARSLEQEVGALQDRLRRTPARPQLPQAPAACPCPLGHAHARSHSLPGRCILYLGGRSGNVPHLRSLVEARNATLLHHDGGVEDNFHRIENLVGQADAVVCPIDCVSHSACKHAKALCRRLEKPFLPIAASSRSSLERALDAIAVACPGSPAG